jgi:hypothetical protein
MPARFFVVSLQGFIYPGEYSSYESACSNCGPGEMVYVGTNLEELEASLEAEMEEDYN